LGRNNISAKFFSTNKPFSRNIHILEISLLFCLAILIILAVPLFADNYVYANPEAVQTGKVQTPPTQNWLLFQVTEGQKKLNKEITNNIRALKKEPKPAVFLGLCGVAFVYGALHAVGPGHGKMVITGWVVSQSRKFREIMMVSVLASFFHAFSSVTIVLATYYIMGKFVPGATEKLNLWLQLAAGVMLAVMGIHILWSFIRRRKNTHVETAGTLEAAEQQPKVSVSTHPFWIALTIGIVPCPLAAIILVFCLANQMLWPGIVIVSVFAAGMGASIFSIALSVWLLKSKAAEFALTQGRNRVLEGLSLLGGLFFIALGLLIVFPYLSGSL
jgi:nickel/cobalt transporter (NicO) family protein